MEFNGDAIIAFWKHMSHKFGSSHCTKGDSEFCKMIAWCADKMGIMDSDDFMKKYSSTIGKKIYTPWKIGSDEKPLWYQIVIIVHEHVHVYQDDTDDFFQIKYLASDAHRAVFEAEAYRTELELCWWRYGALPSIRKVAEKVKPYSVSDDDVDVVEQYLKSSSVSICKGALLGPVIRHALVWLHGNLLQIRQVPND